jgi:protein MpaA
MHNMVNGRSFLRCACLLSTVFALSGCYKPVPVPRIVGQEPPLAIPSPRRVSAQYRLLGRSIQGRPIMAQIIGQGADTAVIMSTIHGNEDAGTPLVERLATYLREHPEMLEGRRVVLLPVANPDGKIARTRENIRGIDLNRNFEAANRIDGDAYGPRPLSEPESRAIERMIREFDPDRIVSIHQPLSCIDYDGPGRALAVRMAEHCTLPVRKLGARPGSLGSYTGEALGIPTITLELPQNASRLSNEGLWQQYGQAMVAAIVYPQRLAR